MQWPAIVAGSDLLRGLLGLPEGLLSTQYFFPWYNNTAMKSQVRFAVP